MQTALHPSIRSDATRIRNRALDAALRELSAMTSEIEHYEDEFSAPQLLAKPVKVCGSWRTSSRLSATWRLRRNKAATWSR